MYLHVPLDGLVQLADDALELLPLLHGQHDALLPGLQVAVVVHVELPYVDVPLSLELRQLDETVLADVPGEFVVALVPRRLLLDLRLLRRRSL